MPTVLDAVRKALGRSQPLDEPPRPPALIHGITRLVRADAALADLFAARARASKIEVEICDAEQLLRSVIKLAEETKLRRIAIPASAFLEQTGLPLALANAGCEVKRWPEMTLDELYDFDCGLTDVFAAVAETGSLVIQSSASHGKSLSLVPPVHIAIVQADQIVPDLVDVFERASKEGCLEGLTIISGPSKTADIELNLVTGVHGPGVVHAFVVP